MLQINVVNLPIAATRPPGGGLPATTEGAFEAMLEALPSLTGKMGLDAAAGAPTPASDRLKSPIPCDEPPGGNTACTDTRSDAELQQSPEPAAEALAELDSSPCPGWICMKNLEVGHYQLRRPEPLASDGNDMAETTRGGTDLPDRSCSPAASDRTLAAPDAKRTLHSKSNVTDALAAEWGDEWQMISLPVAGLPPAEPLDATRSAASTLQVGAPVLAADGGNGKNSGAEQAQPFASVDDGQEIDTGSIRNRPSAIGQLPVTADIEKEGTSADWTQSVRWSQGLLPDALAAPPDAAGKAVPPGGSETQFRPTATADVSATLTSPAAWAGPVREDAAPRMQPATLARKDNPDGPQATARVASTSPEHSFVGSTVQFMSAPGRVGHQHILLAKSEATTQQPLRTAEAADPPSATALDRSDAPRVEDAGTGLQPSPRAHLVVGPASELTQTARTDTPPVTRTSDAARFKPPPADGFPGFSLAAAEQQDAANAGEESAPTPPEALSGKAVAADLHGSPAGPITHPPGQGGTNGAASLKATADPQRLTGPHHSPHPLSPHRQLADAIVRTHAGRVEVMLAPHELGRVTVTLSGEGAHHVAIAVERPETLELLRRHADQLSQDLRESGWGDAQLDFHHQDGRSGDGGQQQRHAQPQTPAAPMMTADRATIATPAPPRPAAAQTPAGRIDIRL